MFQQRTSRPPGSILRDGELMVVPRRLGTQEGAPLPPFCVKCAAPSGPPLARSFYWHEPWVYLLVLPGLLIYAIVALATRKRMDLKVPLCPPCRTRRRNLILTAWLIAAGGVANMFLFAALSLDMGVATLILVAALLAAGVMGALVASPLRPKRIDDLWGVFKGCHQDFLRRLG